MLSRKTNIDRDSFHFISFSRNKYHFDLEEFDEVSSEAKDFITRLLRGRAARRLTGEGWDVGGDDGVVSQLGSVSTTTG